MVSPKREREGERERDRERDKACEDKTIMKLVLGKSVLRSQTSTQIADTLTIKSINIFFLAEL